MSTKPFRNLLLRSEVIARTRLSQTTLWRLVRAGDFPRPVNLGTRRVAWFEDEIDQWITTRPATKNAVDTRAA